MTLRPTTTNATTVIGKKKKKKGKSKPTSMLSHLAKLRKQQEMLIN